MVLATIRNIAGITRVFLIVFFARRDHTLRGVAAVQPVRRRSDATEKNCTAAPDLAGPGLVQNLELIGVRLAGIAEEVFTGDGGAARGGDALDTMLVVTDAKCESNDVSCRERRREEILIHII